METIPATDEPSDYELRLRHWGQLERREANVGRWMVVLAFLVIDFTASVLPREDVWHVRSWLPFVAGIAAGYIFHRTVGEP